MTKPSSRSDIAYAALRQAIIEQAILPGTKLPEDEIGTQFGMSRTLVRATLARLQAEGLVDALPRRTATVAQPSLEEAREVFEVRKALEREVVRLVAKRWRPEFGAELEGHVRKEEAARALDDERVSIRLAGEFHARLAEMAGNGLLMRYLREVISRCSLILALYGRPHSSDCAVNEHSEILAALRRGDGEAAADLMDHHVGAVERRALIGEKPVEADLGTVLARYAGAVAGTAEGAVPIRRTSGRKAT
ncbi:GntR family transcriptional regulator [Methylobrevis albus]|uniref:GntR family transcriptional regulator n=1 Tax=Methylobrevis albus TaxID=2793297 RepID=A0A931I2K8_9HYPH|nr:GntR family transcriptional regulator [Methylobrevis albus]MBH0238309.1 GntR family transcriptional regulator [Methylobrevis albus]